MGPASQQAELILLWVVFTAITPAIEKVREGNPYRGLQVIHPGLPPRPPPLASPPSSAGPSARSLPHTAVGLPPCSELFHALLCCRAFHSPCRSQLESFCSPASAPHATLGCLPCSDSTMSRPAAISRPTSQLQVFVGRTGGLLVCLICSMPSPPAPPIFSSVRAEVVSTLSVHSPRPRQGGRVRNLRQKPPRMTFQKQTGVPPEARPQQGRTRGWGQVY